MNLSITTWNINSIRLRIGLVLQYLEQYQPDILCLQETKCPNDSFPLNEFIKAGFPHTAIHGQKSYNGVAILSKFPLKEIHSKEFYNKPDCRHICVTIDVKRQITLHNFYIPAGGDIPDPNLNEKFAHKLAFLDEMYTWDKLHPKQSDTILVGDLNIAPFEHDVWNHKALLDVVSHTPIECEKLNTLREETGWHDAMREFIPLQEKLYTWWSYRSPNWRASDRGRRLDHIWVSQNLKSTLKSINVVKEMRDAPRPSDHVPVTATLEI